MSHNPETHRFFLLTLDPVHVGTGGTQLGRVDLSIVREPGTRLPKIPGSSLHGMIRAYAAHRYGKPQCAGQGKNHCAKPTCPICYTFGYARDKEGGRAGVVAISDARILLFPVYSMVGPVWVSTLNILQEAGFQVQRNDNNVSGEGPFATFERKQPLNLGWLMIDAPAQVQITVQSQTSTQQDNTWASLPEPIRNRVVLVSDKLFSQIVNSNLEVRTSVSINPETGAAEERALFTYEAIPRATVLWMDVVVSDYRKAFPSSNNVVNKWWQQIKSDWEQGDIPDKYPQEKKDAIRQALRVLQDAGFRVPEDIPPTDLWKLAREALIALKADATRYQETKLEWKEPLDVLNSGLEWAAHLGVGGMSTRGFGRIRGIARCKADDGNTLTDCQDVYREETKGQPE